MTKFLRCARGPPRHQLGWCTRPFEITVISRTECIQPATHERALIIVTCQASHASVDVCG